MRSLTVAVLLTGLAMLAGCWIADNQHAVQAARAVAYVEPAPAAEELPGEVSVPDRMALPEPPSAVDDAAATPIAKGAIPVSALRFHALLVRSAQYAWGLDAPISTFAAQVHQESAWRPDAVSRVGAQGLAQFMPGTTTWIGGIDPQLAAREPFNPAWSLQAMVTYDRWLYERAPTRYSTCDRMHVVMRSYNGGLGHWQAEAKATGLPTPSRLQVDAACGRARRAALHCRENLDYPERILRRHEPAYVAAHWGPGSCS